MIRIAGHRCGNQRTTVSQISTPMAVAFSQQFFAASTDGEPSPGSNTEHAAARTFETGCRCRTQLSEGLRISSSGIAAPAAPTRRALNSWPHCMAVRRAHGEGRSRSRGT